MWMISNLYTFFLAACFPQTCFICRKSEGSLCKNCVSSLRRNVDSPHTYIHAIFSFKDDRVRKIIHAIKYYHRPDLVPPLVEKLLQTLPKDYFTEETLLIPIPMSRFKRWMRGYNQAAQIAYAISEATGVPTHTDILVRRTKKINQVKTKNRKERLNNQKGAFDIYSKTSLLETKNIILIDDVATTGATLEEARKVLLRFGVKKIQAITLAH